MRVVSYDIRRLPAGHYVGDAPQQESPLGDHPTVGKSQVLLGAVLDRPFAFGHTGILVSEVISQAREAAVALLRAILQIAVSFDSRTTVAVIEQVGPVRELAIAPVVEVVRTIE